MKLRTTAFVIAAAVSFAAPAGALAQDTTTDPAMTTTIDDTGDDRDDDSGKWGLVGLLGLAGLMGLKRRDDDDRRSNTGSGTGNR